MAVSVTHKIAPTHPSRGVENTPSYRNEFRTHALWLTEFLASLEIKIQPWISEELPVFSELPAEQQKLVNERLSTWIEMIKSCDVDPPVVSALEKVQRFERQILWRILNNLKLKFASDLFDKIPEDSIVEVYTADNRQVYRSLNFLKVCTYSLEEIYVWPWYELYERDESATRQTVGYLERAVGGELRGIVDEPMDDHWVMECKAGHRLKTMIRPTMMCFFENEASALTGYIYAFRVL